VPAGHTFKCRCREGGDQWFAPLPTPSPQPLPPPNFPVTPHAYPPPIIITRPLLLQLAGSPQSLALLGWRTRDAQGALPAVQIAVAGRAAGGTGVVHLSAPNGRQCPASRCAEASQRLCLQAPWTEMPFAPQPARPWRDAPPRHLYECCPAPRGGPRPWLAQLRGGCVALDAARRAQLPSSRPAAAVRNAETQHSVVATCISPAPGACSQPRGRPHLHQRCPSLVETSRESQPAARAPLTAVVATTRPRKTPPGRLLQRRRRGPGVACCRRSPWPATTVRRSSRRAAPLVKLPHLPQHIQ
jgi:hypothetical protein